jgi:hypothetical protein
MAHFKFMDLLLPKQSRERGQTLGFPWGSTEFLPQQPGDLQISFLPSNSLAWSRMSFSRECDGPVRPMVVCSHSFHSWGWTGAKLQSKADKEIELSRKSHCKVSNERTPFSFLWLSVWTQGFSEIFRSQQVQVIRSTLPARWPWEDRWVVVGRQVGMTAQHSVIHSTTINIWEGSLQSGWHTSGLSHVSDGEGAICLFLSSLFNGFFPVFSKSRFLLRWVPSAERKISTVSCSFPVLFHSARIPTFPLT